MNTVIVSCHENILTNYIANDLIVQSWNPFKRVDTYYDDFYMLALRHYLQGIRQAAIMKGKDDCREFTNRWTLTDMAERLRSSNSYTGMDSKLT